MTMNTAMHIISIQHQLVLGIGNSTDLQAMSEQFLQVCRSRLEPSSCHIFLSQDADHNPIYEQKLLLEGSLNHYLSLPHKKNGQLWSLNQELASIVNNFFARQEPNSQIEIEAELYHCFKIGHFGVLIIERKNNLDRTIQYALTPVLQKLATSYIASIDHQTLIQEIKTRKEVEEQIRYQASHDYLTGLCNRVEMEKRLGYAITYCEKNSNNIGGLLLIDLVNFKNVNDLMGHHVGDKVLRQIAIRLKEIVKCDYTVARFGGDEFIMLLPQLSSDHSKVTAMIKVMIDRVISAIETPIAVQEGTFSLSCFIGYETFSDGSKTVNDIIKNADIAMYEAIKRGNSRGIAYQAEMTDALNKRLHYTEQIENALKNKQFELYYQPQLDNSHHIVGAEALLRWNHPVYGYESPAVYIPIAEESELILEIGAFVLSQACEDIKRLEMMQLPDSFKQVSINISAKQLEKKEFASTIISAIEQSKISAAHLKIEITESIMMGDIELSIAHLQKLYQYGVECAIDDFGTGYCSLAYLKRFPASLLKIDRAFVCDIDNDQSNYAIANMIIELGRNLNMEVIAEGVENQQELDCLIKLGCYQYQGYYFSRPLPFDKLVEFINSSLAKHPFCQNIPLIK